MNDSEALENRDYLLSVLSQETTEIKQLLENALPATLQSNYDKMEFSDDEIRGLITSVLENNFDSDSFRYLISQKSIKSLVDYSQHLSERKQRLDELLKYYYSLKQNHEGKSDPKIPNEPNSSKSGNLSSQEWKYWTGNVSIPKELKYLVSASDESLLTGPSLAIPFKSPVWFNLSQKTPKQAIDTPVESSTQKKNLTQDIIDWQKLSFLELMNSVPWLGMLSTQCLAKLEESLMLENYYDGQTILKEGDHSAFHIIRYGKVGVYRKSKNFQVIKELTKELSSCDIFGFYFIDDIENTSDEKYPKSVFTYRAIGNVSVYSCSLITLYQILLENAQNPLINSFLLESGLVLECQSFETSSNEEDLSRSNIMSSLIEIRSSISNQTLNLQTNLLNDILLLSSSELDFQDSIYLWMQKVKQFIQVDRISIYIVDRGNNIMHLFSPSQNDGNNKLSNGSSQSNKTNGIRMPLKGIAAQVAQFNQIINVEDCYQNEFFDSSMDLKTGYRSKQMLCVPITNFANEVIAVVQVINPIPSRTFSKSQENLVLHLSKLIRHQIFNLLNQLFTSISNPILPRALTLIDGNVRINIKKIITRLQNRHVQISTKIFFHGSQFHHQRDNISVNTSPLFSCSPSNSNDATLHCECNHLVDFSRVKLNSLPQDSIIAIECFSKNNHATGWALFSLFDYNHLMAENGVVKIPLFQGQLPTNYSRMSQINQYARLYNFTHPFYQSSASHSLESGSSKTNNSVINEPSLIHFYQEHCVGSVFVEFFNPSSDARVFYDGSNLSSVLMTCSINPQNSLSFPFIPYSMIANAYEGGFEQNNIKEYSIYQWINSLLIPESRKKTLVQTLSIEQLFNPFVTNGKQSEGYQVSSLSNIVDSLSVLYDHYQSLLISVPQSLLWLLNFINYSGNIDQLKELFESLYSKESILKYNNICTLIPLIEYRYSFNKLNLFSISSLYTIPIESTIMILPFLLTTLAQYPYQDNALYTFIHYTHCIERIPKISLMNYFWELQSMTNVKSNICPLHFMLLKEFLRTLTPLERIRYTNGWIFMTEVYRLYCIIGVEIQVSSPTKPSISTTRSSPNKIKSTKSFVSMDELADSLYDRIYQDWHKKEFYIPYHLSSKTAVVDEKEENENYAVDVYTVLKGRGMSPQGGFNVLCTTKLNTYESLLFATPEDLNLRIVYSQILHSMNFIFKAKNLPFLIPTYNILPLGIGNAAVLQNIEDAESLNSLIVRYIQQTKDQQKSQSKSRFFSNKKGDYLISKIPDDLITNYFRNSKSRPDASEFETPETMDLFLQNFSFSLTGYLISLLVLDSTGFNIGNTFITPSGHFYAQPPQEILGLENQMFAIHSNEIPSRSRSEKQPIFFLPCFVETLGGLAHPRFLEFQTLVNSLYLTLRQESVLLCWTVKQYFTSQNLSDEKLQIALHTLKKSLNLHLDDKPALKAMWDKIGKGLKADYQLKFKEG